MDNDWIIVFVAVFVIIAAAAAGIFIIMKQEKKETGLRPLQNQGWHVELWNMQHGYPVNLEFCSSMVVGRSALCSPPSVARMVPMDRTVSREHILLYGKDGDLWIWNLSAVNPVFVNGTCVSAPQRLLPGERLKLGDSAFLVTRVEYC